MRRTPITLRRYFEDEPTTWHDVVGVLAGVLLIATVGIVVGGLAASVGL